VSTTPRVIACVDQSHFAESVTDHAAWVAMRLDAPLELLHVIDRHPETATSSDRSGAIGPNAQEHLLSQLSSEDEARARAARERGRLFLDSLRERALAAGVAVVDVRQRLGRLDETLHDLQAGARLFVLGRRGDQAAASGLGGQVEAVVRALECPILTVTDRFQVPRRVLMAFDGNRITRQGVEMLAQSPLLRGLDIELVMAGTAQASGPLQAAVARLQAAGMEARGRVVPGEAAQVIPQALKDIGADWLIMGAYTHSPWRSLLRGSHTSELLQACRVPALLLR
jgi:nucleotide-binding universal stress UspA family protein